MKLKKISKNKKAALELSMGTIVILVLAMSMLILGLVLIKAIFSGAKYNVDQMNKKVEGKIAELFAEDQRMGVHLANNIAEIPQGSEWGVAFVLKNQKRATTEEQKFDYEVTMEESHCKLDRNEAMDWIILGREGDAKIAPGQTKGWIIRFEMPETAPLCSVRYNIHVDADSEDYATESFDIRVVTG